MLSFGHGSGKALQILVRKGIMHTNAPVTLACIEASNSKPVGKKKTNNEQ